MAKAYVRGYQGNNMQGNDEILACVKHFALLWGVRIGTRLQYSGYEPTTYV